MTLSNSSEPAVESSNPRFVIGIDLGTTNSAISFVDTLQPEWRVQTFLVPQVIAPGEIQPRETLPSFSYLPAAGEFSDGALRMPWDDSDPQEVVGVFAREQGKLVPGRVVESAKSWLCHSGVDRLSPLLPTQSDEGVQRRSPVDVCSSFLRQMRLAWNAEHPADQLEQQDVVITLPASFDEVARELTIEAAKRAGLPKILLIEEPQAAFYAWLHDHESNWKESVSPGQNILVCDIGGGTTDFTLIRVREHANQQIQFHRIAVGEHLILGGDNLDLALAHALEPRFSPERALSARQWGSLVKVCRHAKETLFSSKAPDRWSVTIPGSGSKLIAQSLSVEVTHDELRTLLIDGFFPKVALSDMPSRQGSGFQEFGLPYASDPAITRHLASFLKNHLASQHFENEISSGKPDLILFNGGAFLSSEIQARITEVITDWYQEPGSNWAPQILENQRHDLAVARGAAYYGMVRRNQGVNIAAGLPRTYYIGVGSDSAQNSQNLMAMALVPAGSEPGTVFELSGHEFELTVASPVEFQLFYSSLRLADPAGTLIPVEREQLTSLPTIRTILRFGKEKQAQTLRVRLHAKLTEIGTLQVWCQEIGSSRSWQLQFDVRSATETDRDAHSGSGEAAGFLDQSSIEAVRELLTKTFGPQSTHKPGGLPKEIARLIDLSRDQWPPAFLRQMWEMLLELEAGRKKSADHEARWLNLLGFSLRPGFGLALDDWRVSETWRILRGKLIFPVPANVNEFSILWRRIAGGLTSGQQQSLVSPLLGSLREQDRRGRTPSQASGSSKNNRSTSKTDYTETWRLIGSLERLPVSTKSEIGEWAIRLLEGYEKLPHEDAILWALSRIGARELFYGPITEVVSLSTVSGWLERLMKDRRPTQQRQFAVMQLSRKTGDRYRDLPEDFREKVLKWLKNSNASANLLLLVQEVGSIEKETSAIIFGDSLPVGLSLRH